MKKVFRGCVVFLLTLEAKLVIKKYKPKIIGITGSVGKTSTKDALYTILSKKLSVRKSEKSFNSEFGVPLTILGLPTAWGSGSGWILNLWKGLEPIFKKVQYPEWLIVEIGADHPGDIEKLTKWLPLDVGIVTGMGEVPVHVEFFPNVEALVREKSFVPQRVKKEGFVLLNTDAPRVPEMKEGTSARVYTYGFGNFIGGPTANQDFHGANFAIQYSEEGKPTGITFRIEYKGKSIPVFLSGTVGAGHAYSAIAALACGELLGLNMVELADSIRDHTTTAGRLRLLDGMNGSILIDDTYNASPVAVRLALDTLAQIQTTGRKIAVLGDMAELGTHSENEHKKIGEYARDRATMLLTFGNRTQAMGSFAKHFDNREKLIDSLQSEIKPGDIILVKGSQSMRMEKVVQAIMAEPDRAKELLVRQDEAWQNR